MAKEKISVLYKKPLKSKKNDTLTAGVATVDITPPPGMPAAGYAIASCRCYGVRNKLKARIFYIKPEKGKPVALVQCDLLSGSLLLHHKVANLIAGETDVDAAALAICATHTHSGPGNYFGNEMYNSNASNKPGLEKKYLDFCSRQMADGIIEAYKNSRPAKIATGTTEIWNATISRSLQPYLQNENIKKLPEQPDALQAVNPYLHLIRIDCLDGNSGEYKPAGLFTNFSIHPNTNPAELGGLYSGDITGFFTREVEKEIKKKYGTAGTPVHGAANYVHGDCNANHDESRVENFKDLRRIAGLMAAKTLELFYSLDNKLENSVTVRYRAREINMLKERKADGVKISKRGYAGMALPAGARGRGRTTFFDKIPVLFQPGRPKKYFNNGLQGHKRIIGGPFQGLILPAKSTPHLLLMQVIQIHDTALIPLPWEVTQEAGRRIGEKAREMGEKAGLKGVKRFIVTDTSNGYFGYVTTPEEYSLQYYEGGSNLYGPNTGPYLAAKAGKLTEEMAKKGSGYDLFAKYEVTLTTKDYYPEKLTANGKRKVAAKPRYHAAAGDYEEPFWGFKWYDVPPSDIDFHRTLVEIEVSKDGKTWSTLYDDNMPVNDEGFDIAVIYQKKLNRNNMGLYEARWHNPPGNDKYYRFKIHPRDNQPVFYSPPFK